MRRLSWVGCGEKAEGVWTYHILLPNWSGKSEYFFIEGYGLDSIHESCDPVEAVRKSEAIFIGKFYFLLPDEGL